MIKAADNRIFAQKLVNDIMAANPELMAIGLHAIPPGGKDQVVIAQTDDIIGKKDSAGDLDVTHQDQVKIYPSTLGGKPRMKVMIAWHDGGGRKIGLAVLSFKPGEGVTALSAHIKAARILEDLGAKVPNLEALFQPTP
ncbi:MAG: Pyrrolo-quinoline quinone beta-propeller repeat-containing protein [Verrucomicrobia bacterium]|nr:Pyrrolo-quinoline quinone beta-propeller repeat-containing protein [Verrucomicrobiota bacterium]